MPPVPVPAWGAGGETISRNELRELAHLQAQATLFKAKLLTKVESGAKVQLGPLSINRTHDFSASHALDKTQPSPLNCYLASAEILDLLEF